MITELGHFALVLAAVVAVVQSTLPLMGAHRRHAAWMALAPPAAMVQFLLTAFAFATLVRAFVVSDFSLRIVAVNSHSLKPMLYKISGTWGNHEGSMLLWVLILTLFGALLAWRGTNLPPSLRARALAVQALITLAFLVFILLTSNPFARLVAPPFDGQGLNPLLQDIGLALHPPFLYLGYVGLSMTFSLAVAALLEGRIDAAWARWLRPWTLAAWVFLTIGIALGSWWAYYELGWGGFWFWDPVENASFMPWLLATALLHSAIAAEKRSVLKSWTILLAILAFGFSLIGTFIVRSGIITSVHAFANDPERGVFILAILLAFVGGALALYAVRASAVRTRASFSLISRESMLVFNNVLLVVACLVVFVGTIWPLVIEMALARKLSVGPPFFNLSFTPFMVVLGAVLPIGAMIPWKRGRIGDTLYHLRYGLLGALALAGLLWTLQSGRSLLAPVGLFLGAWLLCGAVVDILGRGGKASEGRGVLRRLRRLRRLPCADWGKAVAHAGLGVVIFAIAALTAWEIEDIRVAHIGEPFRVGAYGVTLLEVEQVSGANYTSMRATVSLSRNGRQITQLHPERRLYTASGMPTTEAAIDSRLLRDFYVVLGDRQEQAGAFVLRSYVKPMANGIWGGALLMALGGGLSLLDRRYRVAAGGMKRGFASGPRLPRGGSKVNSA